MTGPIQEGLAAAQSVGRWFYFIAGAIWLGGLVFIAVRIYQIWTQALAPAVVISSRLIPQWQTSTETDVDGYTHETSTRSNYRSATVRYEVNGKAMTAEIGQSGTGFDWIEERVMREWKPGAVIRVRIDAAHPDKPKPALGLDYRTFEPTFGLALGGLCFAGFGYVWIRAIGFVVRRLDAYLPAAGR